MAQNTSHHTVTGFDAITNIMKSEAFRTGYHNYKQNVWNENYYNSLDKTLMCRYEFGRQYAAAGGILNKNIQYKDVIFLCEACKEVMDYAKRRMAT